MIRQILALVAVLLLAVAQMAMAQDMCNGNFDCDQDVDGTDAANFQSSFGRSEFNDPCPTCQDSSCPCTPPSGGPSALVPKTGQTTQYATGDDGDLEKGVVWPTPRFTDNGDGIVTDNLTGLFWLKNANCFGTRTWNNALSDSNGLENGECGLTDGSSAGEWRLPNRFELESLLDLKNASPALPSGHSFTNVQSSGYWSSTISAYGTDGAWYVAMGDGIVHYSYRHGGVKYVWPVRGGQ